MEALIRCHCLLGTQSRSTKSRCEFFHEKFGIHRLTLFLLSSSSQVLLDAYASRVIWSDEKDSEGNLIAAGVEYTHGGETKTILASKEVILAAG
jgi:hypothetical protein